MMDILNYINSPDIAAHCRGIGQTFNMLEAASIVAKSGRPLAEILDGWRMVLESYEDISVDEALYPAQASIKSVADRLKLQINNHMKEIEDWLDERDALFCTALVAKYNLDEKMSFRHLDEALAYAQKKAREDEKEYAVQKDCRQTDTIRIDKYRPGQSSQQATYTEDGRLVELTGDLGGIWGETNPRFFLNLNTFIPTPFAEGDILVHRATVGFPYPFLLDKIPYNTKEEFERLLRRGYCNHMGWSGAMGWSIRRVDTEGKIVNGRPRPYWQFQYHHDNDDSACAYIDELRVLTCIQRHAKDKISSDGFLEKKNR